MRRPANKEKWTLSFDSKLKKLVITAAERERISAVAFLENLVREKFAPYGHAEVVNSSAYVAKVRKQSRRQSDADFIAEIAAWHNSRLSLM